MTEMVELFEHITVVDKLISSEMLETGDVQIIPWEGSLGVPTNIVQLPLNRRVEQLKSSNARSTEINQELLSYIYDCHKQFPKEPSLRFDLAFGIRFSRPTTVRLVSGIDGRSSEWSQHSLSELSSQFLLPSLEYYQDKINKLVLVTKPKGTFVLFRETNQLVSV